MINLDYFMQTGQLFDGRYHIIAPLGPLGLNSLVWLVADTQVPDPTSPEGYKRVVLRFYDLGNTYLINRQQFDSLVQVMFACQHPNLLSPKEIYISQDVPYMVYPFSESGNAEQLRGTAGDPRLFWNLVADLAQGLKYLHNMQPSILHQDLNLGNILMMNGHYVISDFAINTYNSTNRSRNWSAAYTAPELFIQGNLPTPASDVWSLGAVLYELLTGQKPYGEAGGSAQSMHNAPIPQMPMLSDPEIGRLLTYCLMPNPADRPRLDDAIAASANQLAVLQMQPNPQPSQNYAQQAEVEARRQAEEAARRQAEEEARCQAEEAARQAEEEARRQAEEAARRQAEEEARRQAEEAARRQAEEAARRQAEEAARRQAEEEAKRRAAEEEEKKRLDAIAAAAKRQAELDAQAGIAHDSDEDEMARLEAELAAMEAASSNPYGQDTPVPQAMHKPIAPITDYVEPEPNYPSADQQMPQADEYAPVDEPIMDYYDAEEPKSKGKWIIIGIVALVVLLGVAAALYFFVFNGKDADKSTEPEGTEQVDADSNESTLSRAIAELESGECQDPGAALATIHELANQGYMPAKYQLAMTYVWSKEPNLIARKAALGIDCYEDTYLPKDKDVNLMAIEYLNQVADAPGEEYAAERADALYRMANYYISTDKVFEVNRNTFITARGILNRANEWAALAEDVELQQKIQDKLPKIEEVINNSNDKTEFR